MAPTVPRYQRLADALRVRIESGALRVGARLPSVRELCDKEAVSKSTAQKALELLEADGLAQSRDRSGFFVAAPPLAVRAVPESRGPLRSGSLIDDVFSDASDVRLRGHFGGAFPDESMLPWKQVNAALARVTRSAGSKAQRYEFPPGLPELRRAIARRMVADRSPVSPDEILITSGALEAVHLALETAAPRGALVATEGPTYFGILRAVAAHGAELWELPTDPKTGVSVEALEAAMQSGRVAAAVLQPNFQNPTGALIPDENKEAIARLAAKYKIPVIEDDVQGDLGFLPRRPRPIKFWDQEGWVLHCSSFSKSMSPGLRVGWLAAGRFVAEARERKFLWNAATATIPQLAVAEFLHDGAFERHLRRMRLSLAQQVRAVAACVRKSFPQGTAVTEPSGGFVLWVELPEGGDTLELYRVARADGISFCPGAIFTASGELRRFLRLSTAARWNTAQEKALCRLGELARLQIEGS